MPDDIPFVAERQAVFEVTWSCIKAAQEGRFDWFEQVPQHKALDHALDVLITAVQKAERNRDKCPVHAA